MVGYVQDAVIRRAEVRLVRDERLAGRVLVHRPVRAEVGVVPADDQQVIAPACVYQRPVRVAGADGDGELLGPEWPGGLAEVVGLGVICTVKAYVPERLETIFGCPWRWKALPDTERAIRGPEPDQNPCTFCRLRPSPGRLSRTEEVEHPPGEKCGGVRV